MTTEAYCQRCKSKKTMEDAHQVTMKNGRPAMSGLCPDCGARMSRALPGAARDERSQDDGVLIAGELIPLSSIRMVTHHRDKVIVGVKGSIHEESFPDPTEKREFLKFLAERTGKRTWSQFTRVSLTFCVVASPFLLIFSLIASDQGVSWLLGLLWGLVLVLPLSGFLAWLILYVEAQNRLFVGIAVFILLTLVACGVGSYFDGGISGSVPSSRDSNSDGKIDGYDRAQDKYDNYIKQGY